ncbi:uncharacterized protein LOC135347367 [Halichondria panicea]|uniref:uncharacterized protein LOC135347367 n=1 Tax=Halichondria panicea TaxID=6063 RepID=UPI00312B4E14
MHLLSFVQMLKWAYFEALMNPILSDSFGFSLNTSSYVFLGVAISSILGSILLVLLQRIKISTQMGAFIGISMTIAGYFLVTDWQAIPYDPCTEYSPFHHPDRFQNNHSSLGMLTPLDNTPQSWPALLNNRAHMDIELDFSDRTYTEIAYHFNFSCYVDEFCPFCTEKSTSKHRCLSFVVKGENESSEQVLDVFSCSLAPPLQNICLSISHHQSTDSEEVENLNGNRFVAGVQSLLVLPQDVYSTASNACINANVSISGECHWIPLSSGEECVDCPPICRGKQRTLLLPLYLIGMVLLIGSYPLVWVNLVAIANNQTPESVQGIVIGSINVANGLAESISPVVVDLLYEKTKKRTFVPSILFALLHIPFLIEIIILYKPLGPSYKLTEYSRSTLPKEQSSGRECDSP